MAAIGASNRSAHSKSTLGEVDSVANGASDAVIGNPLHMRLIDAALINQVLHQAAHWIIGESRHHGGVEPEAALQAASDVVFAPAFPHTKAARGSDARIPGIEPEHHFSQAHQVPLTL